MKDVINELKVDPSNYVAELKSPIGVYIRRAVFKHEASDDFALKNKLYEKTVADQSADGSWEGLFVKTANNLWDLSLLGYNAEDKCVQKGLEWFRSIQRHAYKGVFPGFFQSSNKKDARMMQSTFYGEFGPGCSLFYQTTYAAHLFHTFGFDDDSQVKTTVNSYLQLWGDNGSYCGVWCTLNVLRLLIEHPLSRDSKQVEAGLKKLAGQQTKTGGWKTRHQNLPFYHTFHALSRSCHPLARQQLEKAFPSIIRRQKQDGSWCGKGQETNTFLVLDALKNIEAI